MSFAIDLASNGQALKKAYNQVLSSDPETTWAIFGYEGANALNVQDTGDSLAEFCSGFDDSQVQYGICQVDFNNVNKFVLVGWVGEGTPSKKRTAFNAHFSAVARYFPGYHVQLTAAEDDELTPAVIVSKVASGAGAKYHLTGGKSAPSTKPKYHQSSTGANEDDWGDAAPVQERETSELTKVPTAYTKAKVEVVKSSAPKPASTSKPATSNGERKPIDLKAIREAGKNQKYADTRVEKSEPSYKPIGKVDIKAIHESARKQAEASGKQVDEQYSSLKDRMNAFKLGVEQSKPQFDTNSRSAKHAAKAPVRTTSASQQPSWVKSEEPEGAKEEAESPEPESKPSFADLTSKFAKKDAPAAKTTPAPIAKATPAPAPALKAAEPNGERKTEPKATPSVESGSITAKVVTAYTAEDDDDEISLEVGEVIINIDKLDDFWWLGTNSSGNAGLFPKENVEVVAVPSKTTPAPLARPVPTPAPGPAAESPEAEGAPKAQPVGRSLPPPPPSRSNIPSKEPTPEAAPAPAEDVVYVITAYDADPDADDEISLVVGETITSVDKLDENWWAGINSKGDHGLFPVENVSATKPSAGASVARSVPVPPVRSASPAAAPPSVGEAAGVSAVATATYEADEDDELGFEKGERIINIEFPSADWWSGELNGQVGLFPPDFVQLE